MDFTFRCNRMKCRQILGDLAIVTTCSHIFCVPCAQELGLNTIDLNRRTCPACAAQLSGEDDVAQSQLDPTEDYKTSVLSGLTPAVIMECAHRALTFYNYQATQEIIYQEHVTKSLMEKHGSLNAQLDKVIHEANTEISSLRDRMNSMHVEQKELERKNTELAERLREKAKNHYQLNKLYQTLKQQHLAAGMEMAAEHDADAALFAATQPQGQARVSPILQMRGAVNQGATDVDRRKRANNHAWETRNAASRVGVQTQRTGVHGTPAGHNRVRLGSQTTGNIGRGTPQRSVLNELDLNAGMGGSGHTPGYGGISAGMKVGRQNGHLGPSALRNAYAGSI